MSQKLSYNIQRFVRKQVLFWFLGLLVLEGFAVAFNYIYLKGQAEQTAEIIGQLSHVREFRVVTQVLEAARSKSFTSIHYESPVDRIFFTLPELAALVPDKSLWHRVTTDRIALTTDTASGSSDVATISFEFNRFAEAGYAFGFWILLIVVSVPQTMAVRKRLIEQFNRDNEAQQESFRADLARRVRHDIRTPLAALMRLFDKVKGLKAEETELFQNIISQIRHLVSELDGRGKKDGYTGDVSLYDCVRDSYNELRLVIPPHVVLECEIDDSVFSAQVKFVYHELRSMIANLISNSCDALKFSGKIKISALDCGDEISIRIEDNGNGIASDILARVTEKGFTYGKEREEGTGLGLHLAKEGVEAWGGRLKIESQPGVGTVVSLHLPITNREAWYTPRIKLLSGDSVIIVDDQISVHRLWNMKLDEIGFEGKRLFYFSGEEALTSADCLVLNESKTHVFMDQDLGADCYAGLKALETLLTESQRYLVTGSFDDMDVRLACTQRSIALIPKTELPNLPIVLI